VHYLLPAQFGNGLLAYTKGVELYAEYRPASIWRIRGSYSYLHMNVYKAPNSTDIGTAPGITGASPEHQAMLGTQIDVSKRLQLDVDWRFVSALPSQGVPWYSTADARVGWRLTDQLEFSLVGQNLAQHSHYEDAGDGVLVGIERSGYAQLAWRR
jgi:iron complex outermembrane receptor protein